MGAYSNPQEVVDTQTGQHFQNLQNTISQTVSNVAGAYKSRNAELKRDLENNKKQLLANQLNVDEGNLRLYSEIDKTSAGKQGVDFHATFDPFVKEYGDLNMSLQTGTSKDRPAALKRMAEIRSSISSTQNDIANLASYGESFKKNSANIGNMGGLSSSNDPELVMAYKVFMGDAQGKTSLKVDPSNPNIRTWVVTGEIGGNPFSKDIDGNQLNSLNQKGGGPFVYIPNTMDQSDAAKMQSGVFNVDSKQDSKGNTIRTLGQINDKFLGKEVNVPNPDRVSGRMVNLRYREVDIGMVKDALALDANKQSAGMLADPMSASSWYNEVYAKGKNDFCTALDLSKPEGKKQFQEAYLDFMVSSIKDKQPIMSADGNIATDTRIEAKTKLEGGTKIGSTDKRQIKLDKNIQDIIKTKKGAVVGIGGRTLTLIDGHWRAVEKNGDQIPGTEGISNPNELATFIGGSR